MSRLERGEAKRRCPWLALALLVGDAACGSAPCGQGERCADGGAARSTTPSGDASLRAVQPDAACAMQSVRATRGPAKQVDVIFVVDNSGSMTDEIAAVRQNINSRFASIVAQSGVDFRVILLSLYGQGGTSICIEPPLSGADCTAGLDATNSSVFFHYNLEIGSNDAFCQILSSFDRADKEQRAPSGWQAWLRPDAEKAFVLITDDSAGCIYQAGKTRVQFGGEGVDPFEDALSFHQALLAKSGEQFGVPPEIKYQFFSIVGMAPNDPPTEPSFPYQDLSSQTCDTAPSPGLSYQALSIITDALRYPVCEGRTFDAVFGALARSVIQASKADCVFELPTPPPRRSIDPLTVNLAYMPSDGGASRRFAQVSSSQACKDDHSFFVRDRIELCPKACALVQADPAPLIDILYACTQIPE
jgi:hypothetical protein